METDRLKQFCTIVDTGSLTRAAKLLGISHGGLSKSMATLERDLGQMLFKPEGRGRQVTEQGLAVYRASQAVLAQVDSMVKGAATESGESVLRLGVLEVFTGHFVGELASRYFPGRALRCMELSPGQMEAALLEGTVDYGLTYLPVPQLGIEHVELKSIAMGVHARRGSFAKTPLTEVPFVTPALPAPQNPMGIKERDGWPDALLPRRKLYSCNLLSSALDLARSGLCAIFIPDFLAELHNRTVRPEQALVRLPWPKDLPPVRRKVYLSARIETVEGTEMRRIGRAVRELC